MMILPAQTIRALCLGDRFVPRDPNFIPLIEPFCERTIHPETGNSYGLSHASYDIRLEEGFTIYPHEFRLASTVEKFAIPNDIIAHAADKSSFIRQGVTVFNTKYDPGWRGHATIEIYNCSKHRVYLPSGSPIAQVLFMRLEAPTEMPYTGKYQDQERGPVEARREEMPIRKN